MPEGPTPLEKIEAHESAEIPLSLQEFREVPRGYVSVFVVVPRESLPHLSKRGFRVEDNRMAQTHPRLEEIFQEAATKERSKFSRTASIFAYPRRPEKVRYGLVPYDPDKQAIVEAKIDPARALVADGMLYSEASVALTRWDKEDEEEAMSWARSYWEGAKPLDEYLDSSEDDFHSPEVLIPDDILVNRLRIAR